jgi:hypothetical protein
VNIGWKLAAVLDGWGGDRLLESYEAERRPIAEQTIQEATANMSVLAPELGNPDLQAAGQVGEQARRAAAKVIQTAKDREFHSLGNGFSLLRLSSDADPTTFVEAAAARAVPLIVVDLRAEGLKPGYGAEMLLVRPDQHVAWRGAAVNRMAANAIIDQVRGSERVGGQK